MKLTQDEYIRYLEFYLEYRDKVYCEGSDLEFMRRHCVGLAKRAIDIHEGRRVCD